MSDKPNVYRVDYFYHATGMDKPDRRFIGKFQAATEKAAIDAAIEHERRTRWQAMTQTEADWFRGCLSATIVFPRPQSRNNKTALPMGPPETLRELRLWHWFKAQAFRKSEAQFKIQITSDANYAYFTKLAKNRANVALWHEQAVCTLDQVVTGAALQDAIARGYTNG
jgi:hypothetical protein